MKIIYEGFFVSPEELEKLADSIGKRKGLSKKVVNPHMTTAFKPILTMEKFYGKECDLLITGYANNGKNEGFKVIAVCEDPVLNAIIGKVEHPHITISTGNGGKPVDTGALIASGKVKECKPIMKIKGVFGAFTDEGVITERRA